MFELPTFGAGFAFAWYRHVAHAEVVQVAFHGCLAVAAVVGDRAWSKSGAGGIGWIAGASCGASAGLSISTLW